MHSNDNHRLSFKIYRSTFDIISQVVIRQKEVTDQMEKDSVVDKDDFFFKISTDKNLGLSYLHTSSIMLECGYKMSIKLLNPTLDISNKHDIKIFQQHTKDIIEEHKSRLVAFFDHIRTEPRGEGRNEYKTNFCWLCSKSNNAIFDYLTSWQIQYNNEDFMGSRYAQDSVIKKWEMHTLDDIKKSIHNTDTDFKKLNLLFLILLCMKRREENPKVTSMDLNTFEKTTVFVGRYDFGENDFSLG